jgi:hypothetical protein
MLLILMICFFNVLAWAECKECEEVAKNQIPTTYLDPTLKSHPVGFAIWDIEEAIAALKEGDNKYLWVDTRPESFLKIGTIKSAVHFVCDQKGTKVPETQHGPELTHERLKAAACKLSLKDSSQKIIFFCQGPKCHRSYNAAIRAVKDYGMDSANIVWFRAGYPNLEKYILNDPKLKRRINRYLQGDVLNS